MEIQIPKDPIILSLIIGGIFLIISVIIFAVTKPNSVTNVNTNKKKHLNWFRLIIISIMIGIAVSICTFLILTKDRKIEYSKKEKMGFHQNY